MSQDCGFSRLDKELLHRRTSTHEILCPILDVRVLAESYSISGNREHRPLRDDRRPMGLDF